MILPTLPTGTFCLLVLCAAAAGCVSDQGIAPTSAVATSSLAPSAAAPAATKGLQVVAELPPPDAGAGGESQPISPNDVLEIDVFQVDNLDRTVQVDAAGNISLPLIGAIAAARKTVRQLEQDLEQAYGKDYLQSPDITVFMKESIGQRVTVDGEVTKAGIYPVTSSSTLLDVLALAGGFKQIADPNKVYVYRAIGQKQYVANYNVDQIRRGKKNNPRIYGGDVVVVFESGAKVAFNNLKDVLGVARNVAGIAVLP
jgi:polysaccharide export outer membrane protein